MDESASQADSSIGALQKRSDYYHGQTLPEAEAPLSPCRTKRALPDMRLLVDAPACPGQATNGDIDANACAFYALSRLA